MSNYPPHETLTPYPPPDPLEQLRAAIKRMDKAVNKGCRWIAPLVPKERLRAAMAELNAALEATG